MITPEISEKLLQKTDRYLTKIDVNKGASLEKLTTLNQQILQDIMQLLHDELPHYHWVGIYFLKGDTLVLGPYVGPVTQHVRIPVGRGVCGTAVAKNANQIVSDVRQSTNYLACNIETRSEIVVLVRDPMSSQILGQIDVDGVTVGAFDQSDEKFLEEVGKRLVKYFI